MGGIVLLAVQATEPVDYEALKGLKHHRDELPSPVQFFPLAQRDLQHPTHERRHPDMLDSLSEQELRRPYQASFPPRQ